MTNKFKILNPKTNRMILIVFSGNAKLILESLEAKKTKFKLKEKGESLDLERISLSRIRN